jgi:ABC-type transporter Mla subunit MlaD
LSKAGASFHPIRMSQASESFPPFPPPAGARQPLHVVPPVARDAGSEAARIQALESELASTRAQLQQLQDLLAELPGIFERKFQQRLEPVLQQQHQLQEENSGLREQLRQLPPATAPVPSPWSLGSELRSELRQPPGLLMPSLPQRGPIRIARPRRSSGPAS